VKGFLGSAHDMLEVNGEIHVTHKTTEPYSKWEIERLAEDAGLRLVEKVRFKKAVPSNFPGILLEIGPKQALKPKFMPCPLPAWQRSYRHSWC